MTIVGVQIRALPERLEMLDLECVKFKLVAAGWTQAQADRVETLYKRYLYLALRYPEVPLVPTEEVDEFWHHHILDTRKYASDCEAIFGYFLHHCPYFGMRGASDVRNMREAFRHTKTLYEREFGHSHPKWGGSATSDAAFCGGGRCSDIAPDDVLWSVAFPDRLAAN